MYYEINVSFHGRHFFATAPRSLQESFITKQVLREITKRFPEEDGYKITVTRYETFGKVLTMSDF